MPPREQRTDESKSGAARRANERIVRRSEALHFNARIPLMCECDDADCTALLLLSRDEYRDARSDPGAFICAPGHTLTGAGPPALQTERYWILRR